MKGLIYKEFYLERKTYLTFFLLSLVFSVLGSLVALSIICGNLQTLAAQDPEQARVLITLFTYLPFLTLLVSVCGTNRSVYDDYASGFMYYSYTLPTKAVKAVGARYLYGMIVFLFCFLYGSVNALIIHTLTNTKADIRIFQNMSVLLVLAMILYAIALPLALRYKTSRAVSVRIIIPCVFLYFLCMSALFRKLDRLEALYGASADDYFFRDLIGKYESLCQRFLPFLPLFTLIILGISFYASVKIYQRREQSC